MSKADTCSAGRKALTAIPYCAELDAQLLQMLARAAVRRAYAPSEAVFLESEPCAGLFVVESGWLKSVKAACKRVMSPYRLLNDLPLALFVF